MSTDGPRVGDRIETVEQLDALPVESVVITSHASVHQRKAGGGRDGYGVVWATAGFADRTQGLRLIKAAPLTVLFVPGEQEAAQNDETAGQPGEQPRPATCCGKCPPLAGGGYDCTCEGNPRCERAATVGLTVAQEAAIRAESWDEGYTSGHSNAMRRMSDEPSAPTTPNPYRLTASCAVPSDRAATVEEIAEHLRAVAVADEDSAAANGESWTGEDWDEWLDEALTSSHVIDGKTLRIEGRPEAIARVVLALLRGGDR